MKCFRTISALLLIGVSTVFFSCKKNKEAEETKEQLMNNLKGGEFEITKYQVGNQDLTAQFAGYTFAFKENDVLEVKNNFLLSNHHWKVTIDDDKNPGNIYDFIEFHLLFSENTVLQTLNDDYDVIYYSGSRLELVDMEDEPNQTVYLTFEKNT